MLERVSRRRIALRLGLKQLARKTKSKNSKSRTGKEIIAMLTAWIIA